MSERKTPIITYNEGVVCLTYPTNSYSTLLEPIDCFCLACGRKSLWAQLRRDDDAGNQHYICSECGATFYASEPLQQDDPATQDTLKAIREKP